MRSETPTPLTLEEHRELSEEMKRTTARLRQLCDLVISVYGAQSRAGYSFQNAIQALERVHQELEVQALADLKGYVEKLYS